MKRITVRKGKLKNKNLKENDLDFMNMNGSV